MALAVSSRQPSNAVDVDATRYAESVTTIADLVAATEQLWPSSGAESWDSFGLTAGRPDWNVSRVLVAVDATQATVDEAIAGDYDLLLTHHPLLLRGVSSIAADTYKGSLITDLILGHCGLLSAHTNADVVETGATSVLAKQLRLEDVSVISQTSAESVGIGRVGNLPEPISLGELARAIADVIPSSASGVRVAGDWSQPVRRVAVCSGAGDSLLAHPDVRQADVYITSDLRHHPAQESREQSMLVGGPALVDISHWASEWLWCEGASTALSQMIPGLTVDVSDLNTDPWNFVVHATPERAE